MPELGRLLRANPSTVRTEGIEEALVVTTRAQQRKKEMEEAIQAARDEVSGTKPNLMEGQEEVGRGTRARRQAGGNASRDRVNRRRGGDDR